jgi:phospholipid transport system substrate-binding protein
MKKLALIFALLSMLYAMVSIAADQPPPVAMASAVSNQVLDSLKQNKDRLNDRDFIFNLVNNVAIPHFDVDGISRAVVGPNYWEPADSATKQEFIKTFKHYVIDMYSSALAAYQNETIEFKPLRNYLPDADKVQVYSVIIRPNAPEIDLNYSLARFGNEWKIYDFSVDGISMVQSYRSQFASTLKNGGMSKLIVQLKARAQ